MVGVRKAATFISLCAVCFDQARACRRLLQQGRQLALSVVRLAETAAQATEHRLQEAEEEGRDHQREQGQLP